RLLKSKSKILVGAVGQLKLNLQTTHTRKLNGRTWSHARSYGQIALPRFRNNTLRSHGRHKLDVIDRNGFRINHPERFDFLLCLRWAGPKKASDDGHRNQKRLHGDLQNGQK